jgi:prepilin-type N-terminal cleavage/methylation domain-containing protein
MTKKIYLKEMKKVARQQGMTLIELAVVLLVLVGLASLAIPYVSGFVSKTHNSTSAASGADLANAVLGYAAGNNGSYPANLDALLDSTGALSITLDDSYAAQGTTTVNSYTSGNFALMTVTTGSNANALKSLNAAGIYNVAYMPQNGTYTLSGNNWSYQPGAASTTGDNATYFVEKSTYLNKTLTATTLVTSNDASIGVTANTATAVGVGAAIANALNYNSPLAGNSAIVVLGIGQGSSLIGQNLTSAPVHFGDKSILQPQLVYSRFLAAFDVDTSGSTAAKFIGIVHAPDKGDGWESLSSSINGYYGG